MAKVATQLQEIVDGIARTGALTPDAIRQFDDLKKRCDELSSQLDAATQARDKAQAESTARGGEISTLKASVEATTKRAEAAESKNIAADKAIWVAQFETDRRQELRSIVSDVFRNAEVQRTISHSVPVVIPPTYQGGMPMTQYQTDTRTETETLK